MAKNFYAITDELGKIETDSSYTQSRRRENLANLAESDDIAIETNVTGDNASVSTFAYENNGTNVYGNGNVVGSNTGDISGNSFAIGNTLNFDSGGLSPQRYVSKPGENATVQNYRSARGDVIGFEGKGFSGAYRDMNGITLQATDNTNFTVTTEDSVDTDVAVELDGQRVNAQIGQTNVDNRFKQRATTGFYLGGYGTDVIDVDGAFGENVSIDLGSQSSNVEGIDASSSTSNNIFIGSNGQSNFFLTGAGDNKAYGGLFSNDFFVSGAGRSEFYFGVGGGVDTVLQSKSSDRLELFNVTLADISFAGQIENNYAVILNSGDAIVMDGNIDREIGLAGQTFQYSAATQSYTQVTA